MDDMVDQLVGSELTALQELYNNLINFVVTYGFQVIGAIIILLLGIWISSKLAQRLEKFMLSKELDVTLSHFTAGVIRILLLTCFVIISLGKFGISVTPFIAAIGAIGLGAGLAVQGLLSNYSAGLAIVVTRPFVVGNTITVSGVSGQVKEIKLAATILETEDGEEILMPNRHVVGEILENSFANRLVETEVGVSYSNDPKQAVAVVKQAIEALDCVVTEPGAQVGIERFGESSIDIGVRCWVPTARYHQSRYRINEAIFDAVQQGGFDIPFPQRDVHLKGGE